MDGSFDADNPWITNPPDNHPCLPGVADDDEVHLSLFLAFYFQFLKIKRCLSNIMAC